MKLNSKSDMLGKDGIRTISILLTGKVSGLVISDGYRNPLESEMLFSLDHKIEWRVEDGGDVYKLSATDFAEPDLLHIRRRVIDDDYLLAMEDAENLSQSAEDAIGEIQIQLPRDDKFDPAKISLIYENLKYTGTYPADLKLLRGINYGGKAYDINIKKLESKFHDSWLWNSYDDPFVLSEPNEEYEWCDYDAEELQQYFSIEKGEFLSIETYVHAEGFSDGMAAVEIDGKWGFINREGQLVIQPQFDEVASFSEGVCAVRLDDKCGFIDKDANVVIPFVFDTCWCEYDQPNFHDGMVYMTQGERSGFINHAGEFVIEMNLSWYSYFKDGLSIVELNDKPGIYGLLDKNGKFVIEPICKKFDGIKILDDGLISVCINSKWGLMTTTGATIIEPIYDRELKFHSGISQINTERKWGYIGIDGKILVEPEYDYATPAENGFAVVRRGCDAPKFYIIDVKNEKTSKELPYQLVGGFHEGLAKAKIDGKWGYMDRDGELVIPARYETAEDVTDFRCGHAFVRVDGLWGLINTTGDTVVEPKYSKIGETSNGLAIVYYGNIFSGGNKGLVSLKEGGRPITDTIYDKISFRHDGYISLLRDGKWGLMDYEGQMLLQPDYCSISPVEEGIAVVNTSQPVETSVLEETEDKKRYRIITRHGKFVGDQPFENHTIFYNGLARVKCDGLYGYIDHSGEFVIKPQFEDAGDFYNDLAGIKTGGKWGAVDKSGKIVISPAFDSITPSYDAELKVLGYSIDGKHGLMDFNGNRLIDAKYDSIDIFPDFVHVSIGNKTGLVNWRGEALLEIIYDDIKVPEDASRFILIQQSGLWGYADLKGRIVIEPQFDEAELFHEGVAAVNKNAMHYYIDANGDNAFGHIFDCAENFSNGIAIAGINGRIGVINHSGTFVVPPVYDKIEKCEDSSDYGSQPEYYIISLDGKEGLMDGSGKILAEPIYDRVSAPRDGIVIARRRADGQTYDDLVSLIDFTGKVVAEINCDCVWNFREGLAQVSFGDLFTTYEHKYIDKTGKIVIEGPFEDAGDFHGGMAYVRVNDRYGYINREGDFVIKPEFSKANDFNEGVAWVNAGTNENPLWGLLDVDGNWIVEPQFKACYKFNSDYACVEVYPSESETDSLRTEG